MGNSSCCSTSTEKAEIYDASPGRPCCSDCPGRPLPEAQIHEKCRLFVASQSTDLAWSLCSSWLGNLPEPADIVLSATGFNLSQVCESIPTNRKNVDVPCFGTINDAVMDLFADNIEIMSCAVNLGMYMPRYKVDTYLQSMMGIVIELAELARCRIEGSRMPPGSRRQNLAAADKLEDFAKAFAALDGTVIHSVSDWAQFVEEHVAPLWEKKLAFKDVLSNFGFDDEFSLALRKEVYQEADDHIGRMREVTWEQYAVRWVSKALSAFKPDGCLADVVNLIYAMVGKECNNHSMSEIEVAREVRSFKERLKVHNTDDLWIPTHLMVDCGADDMLCWCVLDHIHKQRGSRLAVLAQLPIHESIDTLEARLKEQPNCKVFRDRESLNLGALQYYWRIERVHTASGLFVSGQITAGSWEACESWICDIPAEADIRISACPFNLPELSTTQSTFPVGVLKIDVPCFGRVLDAVMELYTIKDVLSCSDRMKIRIPDYKVDTFIKSRMEVVRVMIREARARDDCVGQNVQALANLESFANEFEAIHEGTIRNLDDWKTFVSHHVSPGWEKRLSFDKVLENFGFDSEFSLALRNSKPKGNDSGETWQHRGVRWVSKALGGYKPVGCLADVVNLVFSMTGHTPANVAAGMSEDSIIDVIRNFKKDVESNDFSKLWVPTHVMLDCESDDMLLWVLLASIHHQRGSKMQVLAQLPQHPDADHIEDYLTKVLRCKVYRDPDSQNLEAIKHYWKSMPCSGKVK